MFFDESFGEGPGDDGEDEPDNLRPLHVLLRRARHGNDWTGRGVFALAWELHPDTVRDHEALHVEILGHTCPWQQKCVVVPVEGDLSIGHWPRCLEMSKPLGVESPDAISLVESIRSRGFEPIVYRRRSARGSALQSPIKLEIV